jgi:hypothetical protein
VIDDLIKHKLVDGVPVAEVVAKGEAEIGM